MQKKTILFALLLMGCELTSLHAQQQRSLVDLNPEEVKAIVTKVNRSWQALHRPQMWAFWDIAAYHTGNMAAYHLTGEADFMEYSLAWAEYNDWKGATAEDRTTWKYSYGESADYVLFGDWQICFQTYIDLYRLQQDPRRIARAKEVMDYQLSTSPDDYWWWADGLYMVMPVLTKLYTVTDDTRYLDGLYRYFRYADELMFDQEAHLYYRDGKYIYPKHQSVHGKKDFWARGDGWVLAGLAKVLSDLPPDYAHRPLFEQRFQQMARAVADSQQEAGYWTRSMLDPEHAPGPETSGTAFFTYGILWGINNGFLDEEEYLPVVDKAWHYLQYTALQENGAIGYVQPIGEKAIPGQIVDQQSTAGFGVGAFLLAAVELYYYLNN